MQSHLSIEVSPICLFSHCVRQVLMRHHHWVFELKIGNREGVAGGVFLQALVRQRYNAGRQSWVTHPVFWKVIKLKNTAHWFIILLGKILQFCNSVPSYPGENALYHYLNSCTLCNFLLLKGLFFCLSWHIVFSIDISWYQHVRNCNQFPAISQTRYG